MHCGPFGNIAHGCNSLGATRTSLASGDVVITEAGFGSDLGAEKLFDLRCRVGGLNPEAAVLVKTQYSLTDDAPRLGRPTGFRITVNEVYGSAGAGFVVAKTGDITAMPGLGTVPAAEEMKVHPDGTIEGLS